MNNNVKLSTELHPSKFLTSGYDRTSKIDIKGICQKFESLSGAVGETSVPVVPLRRKRSSQNIISMSSSNNPNDFKSSFSNGIKLSTAKTCGATPASVKERTKLFESPVLIDELNASGKSKKNINRLPKDLLTNQDNFTKKNETNDKISFITPPAKPPRTFLHSDIIAKNVLYERFGASEEKSVIKTKEVHLSKSVDKFSFSPNSTEKSNSESISKNLSHNSSCEIVSTDTEKSLQVTPKITKYAGKAHLKNYLKNISNAANNVCEKLKQSSIFVDLTPTTVSPPKRYGTLKKSLSDEHIYAEPISLIKSSDSDESKNPVEPLHYMVS